MSRRGSRTLIGPGPFTLTKPAHTHLPSLGVTSLTVPPISAHSVAAPYLLLLDALSEQRPPSQNGHNDTVLWLLQQGVDVHCPSYHTCQCPSRHLQRLVERGMTDPSDAPSATALALALAHGHKTTARVLAESGAHWADDDISEDVDSDDGDHGPCLLTDGVLSGRPSQYVSSLCIMAANGMHSLISWLGDTEPGTLCRAASMYDMQDFNALHYVVCIEQKKHLVGTKEKITTESTEDIIITATVKALLSTSFDLHAKVAHFYQETFGDRLCNDGGCTVSAYDLTW